MKTLTHIFIIAVLLGCSHTAQAQSAGDLEQLKAELAALRAQVQQQQKQIETLEKAQQPTDAAPKPAKAEAPVSGWISNRPSIRNADDSFEANLGGFVHFDYRGYEAGNHPPNTFLVRRARLFLDGKVARYFDYKIEGDFADTASTILRDGWLRIHRWEPAQFQFGQFKEPFSQEELRSDQVQDFVERSLADSLAPSRSPGFMFLGNVHKGLFEYQAGLFNGKGLLANNTSGTPEAVARVRFTPAKNTANEWIKGLSFGSAVVLGRNSGTGVQGFRGQTESKSFTFYSPDTAKGAQYRANAELTWVKGPGAVRSEYTHAEQDRSGLGAAGSDLPSVQSNAFMVQATYLLTGEKKTDVGPVVPKHDLFAEGTHNGFGAWELKARYAYQDINNHGGKSNRASTMYVGLNWYLNRYVKNVFDFGVEQFRNPSLTPTPGDRTNFVFLNRIQFAF